MLWIIIARRKLFQLWFPVCIGPTPKVLASSRVGPFKSLSRNTLQVCRIRANTRQAPLSHRAPVDNFALNFWKTLWCQPSLQKQLLKESATQLLGLGWKNAIYIFKCKVYESICHNGMWKLSKFLVLYPVFHKLKHPSTSYKVNVAKCCDRFCQENNFLIVKPLFEILLCTWANCMHSLNLEAFSVHTREMVLISHDFWEY